MEWLLNPFFNIPILILAIIGALMIVAIVWIAIADGGTAPIEIPRPASEYRPYTHGTMEQQIFKDIRDDEPTLKGRVDMIEKHLGIKVEVKPFQPSKLTVRKK